MTEGAYAHRAGLPLHIGSLEAGEERGRFGVERADMRRFHFPLAGHLEDDELAVAAHREGGHFRVRARRSEMIDHIVQGGDQCLILCLVVRHIRAKGQPFDPALRARPQFVRAVSVARIPARAAIENNRVLRLVSFHCGDGIMSVQFGPGTPKTP